MLRVRKLRVSNPHKRRRSRNSRRRARRNPAEVLIVANPRRRSRTRRNRSKARKSRQGNPFRTKIRRRGHRRSNPSGALGMGVRPNELLTLSLGAGAGMLGSKALAQLVLGSNNTGFMGLGATAIAGGVIAFAAKKFVGKEAAVGVIAGTGGAIALALWQQYVSGTGSGAMSGLGDPDMAGVLGEYRPGVIPMPANFSQLAPPPPQKARGRG